MGQPGSAEWHFPEFRFLRMSGQTGPQGTFLTGDSEDESEARATAYFTPTVGELLAHLVGVSY